VVIVRSDRKERFYKVNFEQLTINNYSSSLSNEVQKREALRRTKQSFRQEACMQETRGKKQQARGKSRIEINVPHDS
jgi:hypothetical protein